jgi:hypothetical protein
MLRIGSHIFQNLFLHHQFTQMIARKYKRYIQQFWRKKKKKEKKSVCAVSTGLTPNIFTLTHFACAAQNNSKFWRPIGYIPSLGYGRRTSNKTHTRDKIQDKHSCISLAFQSLKNINKENGFQCVVLGYTVRVKVWIHFFFGDTEGKNKWLGQYPGNRECKCQFHDLSNPNPNCTYLTMEDIIFSKNRKQEDEDTGIEQLNFHVQY